MFGESGILMSSIVILTPWKICLRHEIQNNLKAHWQIQEHSVVQQKIDRTNWRQNTRNGLGLVKFPLPYSQHCIQIRGEVLRRKIMNIQSVQTRISSQRKCLSNCSCFWVLSFASAVSCSCAYIMHSSFMASRWPLAASCRVLKGAR